MFWATLLYPQTGETEDIKGLGQQINKVLKYLISPQLQQNLSLIRIVFIAFSIAFIFLIIYFLAKSDYMDWVFLKGLKNFIFPKTISKKRAAKKWEKIKKDLDKSKVEAQWKVALIEALDLFDAILIRAGYGGENLSERLKILTKEDVPNLDKVIEMSKVCQNIIQDPDYKIEKSRAKEIIDVFEKALTELEFL